MRTGVTLDRIKQENLGIEYGKYFQDFLRAVLKVALANSCYLKHTEQDFAGNIVSAVWYERIFAYELYHQFRKLMEDNPTEYPNIPEAPNEPGNSNKSIILSGEMYKNNRIYNRKKYSPDLVLHNPCDMSAQRLLCEMKLKTNPFLLSDLKKIKKMYKGLQFQCNIFLLIGADLDFLKRKIRVAMYKQLEKQWLMSTICVCLHNDGKALDYATLEEIIQEIE